LRDEISSSAAFAERTAACVIVWLWNSFRVRGGASHLTGGGAREAR
jgi:hypothetical protein